MKIRDLEAIPLAYPEPNDAGATQYLCLVRLRTDDGRVGWGESWTRSPEATHATCKIVDGLASLVVGHDPLQSALLWMALRDRTYWYGNGGIASMAISAIDIGMWDLKGQILGQPIVALLGGAVRKRLPAIAVTHLPDREDLNEIAQEVARWMASGFRGYKFGMVPDAPSRLGVDHDRDVVFVRALREAIGPDRELMVDVRAAFPWDVATAVRRVQAFEAHGIRWIEEPLGHRNIEGYRTLRAKTNTLIAFGEREWTVSDYERLLNSGVVDVVGVDPGRVEGITGSLKIVEQIERADRHFNAHAWSGAVLSAASLALACTTRTSLVFELKPLRNPMQHELVVHPIEPLDGWVTPLSGPGLGIEIVEEAVQHYRLDR